MVRSVILVISLLFTAPAPAADQEALAPTGMSEIRDFGSNPGKLSMQLYRPKTLREDKIPLIVALHGCYGSARQFSAAGFNELAEKYHFYVLYPEQRPQNHPIRCFSQLIPGDAEAGEREFHSILQMIYYMINEMGVSSERVFLVGFSSGGQVANILAATHPELFRAAAIIGAGGYVCEEGHAGIADFARCYGKNPPKTQNLSAAKKTARKRWPRISIWHGKNDQNVLYHTMQLAVTQWKRVHKPRGKRAKMSLPGNIAYDAWKGVGGKVVVEAYTLGNTAHTIPVSKKCGKPGGYFKEEDICFAKEVVRFFGIR